MEWSGPAGAVPELAGECGCRMVLEKNTYDTQWWQGDFEGGAIHKSGGKIEIFRLPLPQIVGK